MAGTMGERARRPCPADSRPRPRACCWAGRENDGRTMAGRAAAPARSPSAMPWLDRRPSGTSAALQRLLAPALAARRRRGSSAKPRSRPPLDGGLLADALPLPLEPGPAAACGSGRMPGQPLRLHPAAGCRPPLLLFAGFKALHLGVDLFLSLRCSAPSRAREHGRRSGPDPQPQST